MNPRGRQFALGGTVTGWSRIGAPTAKQRRILRRSYRGLEPRVISRYGRGQWRAALPGQRHIVKDPFALLSIPAVAKATGADTVLIYRPAGAALASYRRMGWSPDIAELDAVVKQESIRLGGALPPGVTRASTEMDDVAQMAWFWNVLHGFVLADLATTPMTLISHRDLSSGGMTAARRLYDLLGLTWSERRIAPQFPSTGPLATETGSSTTLHNFTRPPAQVTNEWRDRLAPGEADRIDDLTAEMRSTLERHRVRLDH